MKYFLLLTCLWLLSYNSYCNKIEALETREQVNRFILENIKLDSYRLQKFLLGEIVDSLNQYGKNRFFKIDMNKDGLTDLIINGDVLFAIKDNGNNFYSIHYVDYDYYYRHLIQNITVIEGQTVIISKIVNAINPKPDDKNRYDTLVFLNNDFAEYSASKADYQIERVWMHATGCFGDCPTFDIVIERSGDVVYKPDPYGDSTKVYHLKLPPGLWNLLKSTLCYIRIKDLKSEYGMDLAMGQLRISTKVTFSNGEEKSIVDHFANGTNGLKNLYNQIVRLTEEYDKD